MNKKLNIYYLIVWVLTILLTITWTYENPEKIKRLKDFLKYEISIGKLFVKIKSGIIKKNYESSNTNTKSEVDSAYNVLTLDHYTVPVYSSYGGIENFGNNIIYLSGDSDLFLLKNKTDNLAKYEFTKIPIDTIKNKKKLFIKVNESKVGKKCRKIFWY